jgi:hypothetical protein
MATLFSLEAVFAKHGDALILHYGSAADPKLILIDGGAGGVYTGFLEPRLRDLRDELGLDPADPLRFEMVMVSHIDDDHINGVLDLFRDNDKAKTKRQPLPYEIGTLWHNSFDDLLDNRGGAAVAMVSTMAASVAAGTPSANLPKMAPETEAVIASTPQGRDLRDLARKLRVAVNKPFSGLVRAAARKPAKKVALGSGLSFTIVGPDSDRIDAYQERWRRDLAKIKKDKRARVSAFDDDSPFNLASICVLATLKSKTMLLTGDARGDFVIDGLERAGLLTSTTPLHVDLLKVPHHGSDRNVEDSFFERITADHYVISGNGGDGNPERATLEMIQRARGRFRYTVHFTFTADAHKSETNAERKAALKGVDAWAARVPPNCTVVFRDKAPDARSVVVDLLDALN